jgi:PAS domain S-box-containing protein
MAYIKGTQTLQQAFEYEDLLNRITSRIRQSLDLEEILTTTVLETRLFLGTDRVKIYRFQADGSGEVIAESIYSNRLPSLLGLHFPADDIPPHARELFIKARLRVIVDIASGQKTLNLLDCPETGKSQDIEDIRYSKVDPCHAEYLSAMGVRSSLVLPILHQNKLWGLLISHHAEPRRFSESELKTVQLLADQVAIAIAQSILLSQARQQAQYEATINQISSLLHSPLDITEIRHTVLEETVKALQGSGGRLYITADTTGQSAQLYTYGVQPTLTLLEASPCWQQLISSQKDALTEDNNNDEEGVDVDPWGLTAQLAVFSRADNYNRAFASKNAVPYPYTITDLYQEPLLQSLVPAFESTPIRTILIVPLQYRQQRVGYLSIFRNEIETETLWAGRREYDERNQRPRLSFEAWREIKKGQAQAWSRDEIKLVQSLGTHLYITIVQRYVQEESKRREEELRRQNLRSQLFAVNALKIRQSLQIEEILQTAVTEVRNLLQADRVLIYRLWPDGTGSIVTEAVVPQWPGILGENIIDRCFQHYGYIEQYRQGRIRAITDIEKADIQPCHLEFLKQFEVKANLVVPILQKEDLWGLLIAHQCASTRQWSSFETELLKQLADQIGIALAQAQLLEALRESEEHYALAIRGANEGIWDWNLKTNTVYFSSAWKAMLGYQEHQIGDSVDEWLNRVHPDEQEKVRAQIAAHLEGISPQFKSEHRMLHQDGTYRWMFSCGLVVRDAQANACRIAGSQKDITERKRAEEEILKALEKEKELSELKSRFVAMVSHEFRTPLTTILSSAELLEYYGHKSTEKEKLDLFHQIRTAIQRTTQLLDDVLAINRAEAGKLEFKLAPLELEKFCRTLVEELQLNFGNKHAISLVNQGECTNACMDEKLLRHIFINLLSNAVKYSPQGGTIHFEVACQNEAAIFQVKDEGIGIPVEDQQQLFESFHRAKNVGNIPGTGLGLSIVKRLVELHQGSIAVASQLGVGTTFTVTLPLNRGINKCTTF